MTRSVFVWVILPLFVLTVGVGLAFSLQPMRFRDHEKPRHTAAQLATAARLKATMSAAQAALAEGAYAVAERKLREVWAAVPGNLIVADQLAQVLDAEHKDADAYAVYKVLIYPPHDVAFGSLDEAQMHTRFAQLCLKFGDPSGANAAYQSVVPQRLDLGNGFREDIHRPVAPDAAKSLAYIQAGTECLGIGDSRSAETAFHQALQAQPALPEATYFLAIAHDRNGELAQAKSDFADAARHGNAIVRAAAEYRVLLMHR